MIGVMLSTESLETRGSDEKSAERETKNSSKSYLLSFTRLTISGGDIMVYIDLAALADGLHEIVLTPAAEDLELDPDSFSSIEATVGLDISTRQILCRIAAKADARLICDRTLEPFIEPLSGDYTVVFTRDPHEGQDDEIVLIESGASRIDITEYLRDTILLSVPLRKVAPAAREAELQLEFGRPDETDEATDPRWDALRKLRTGS